MVKTCKDNDLATRRVLYYKKKWKSTKELVRAQRKCITFLQKRKKVEEERADDNYWGKMAAENDASRWRRMVVCLTDKKKERDHHVERLEQDEKAGKTEIDRLNRWVIHLRNEGVRHDREKTDMKRRVQRLKYNEKAGKTEIDRLTQWVVHLTNENTKHVEETKELSNELLTLLNQLQDLKLDKMADLEQNNPQAAHAIRALTAKVELYLKNKTL